MGLFRALNRKFETDVTYEIYERVVSQGRYPAKTLRVECHQGKGGDHFAFFIPLKHGVVIGFHYCGGEGFVQYASDPVWTHAPWMQVRVNEAAQRIIAFLIEIAGNLQFTEEFVNEANLAGLVPFDDSLSEARVLLEKLKSTELSIYNPGVVDTSDFGIQGEKVCIPIPDIPGCFLIISKGNSREGLDGKWQAFWFDDGTTGEGEFYEIDFKLTIQKTLTHKEQLSKLVNSVIVTIEELSGIETEDEVPESWINPLVQVATSTFTTLPELYECIALALTFRDFSGTNQQSMVLPFIEGETEALTFLTKQGTKKLIIIAKTDEIVNAAGSWDAVAFYFGDNDKPIGSKVYDWNFVLPAGKVVDNGVGQVADAIAELTHRICWGDLRD